MKVAWFFAQIKQDCSELGFIGVYVVADSNLCKLGIFMLHCEQMIFKNLGCL